MYDGLSAFGCFKRLPQEQRRYLLQDARPVTVPRLERLFEAGNLPAGVFCLKAGSIRIGIVADSGHERTIDVVLPGGTFGEASIFKSSEAPVYAQALIQSDLLCISNETILTGIQQWPEMATVFLELACTRINQLLAGMYVCCLRNAHQRVNDFLLKNAQPVGESDSGNSLLVGQQVRGGIQLEPDSRNLFTRTPLIVRPRFNQGGACLDSRLRS